MFEKSLIGWGSIFAGLFVALVTYSALLLLGMAVGSDAIPQVAEGSAAAESIGIGATLWAIVAVLISLFAGGFAASQMSGRIPYAVGRVQGLVVASMFFAVMFTQAGLLVGALGSGIGGTARALGQGVLSSNMVTNMGQKVVGKAMRELNLRSPTDTVVQNVTERLVRGDTDSALTYLANEAGISRADAEARINNFKAEFQQAVADATVAAARAVKLAAVTLFTSVLLGCGFAVLGGHYAVRRSLQAGVDIRSTSYAA